MQKQLDNASSGKAPMNTRRLVLLGVIILWLGLFAGSAYLIKDYIDTTMSNIQQTNAMHVQNLDSRLNTLSEEMKQIKELLQNTDQTLNNSGSTQKALNDKIENLDKQLKALEKSLNVLKEAPDEVR